MKIRILYIFLLLLGSGHTLAQGYEAEIPLFDEERELGPLKAYVEEEKLIWVEKSGLVQLLTPVLSAEALASVSALSGDVIRVQEIKFPLILNLEELKIQISIDMAQRSREKLKLRQNPEDEDEHALRPAPFGGAINTRLEHNWGNESLGARGLNGQFNSFLNMKSVVLENQTFYQEGNSQEWYRGDSRLVKDFEKHEIRTQAGDIYPQLQGFMVSRPLGGLNVQRNFSLNPYRLPYPTGTQDFTLKSRSLVKYYVNGVLVKTEYLSAGKYSATDIPLNNGLNTIVIEATDDLGFKQVFTFRSTSSINLLNRGESRFDVSYGIPFIDNAMKRDYLDGQGKLFSGFYQYGISSEYSVSGYAQSQRGFSLLGSEIITATRIGNLSFGHAESQGEGPRGQANGIGYQYVSQGRSWYQSHSLGLRFENRSDDFRQALYDGASAVKNNYAFNYALPLVNVLTLSLGGNYGDVRDNSLADRYGFDTTLNLRVFDHHNLTFFLGRSRDERKTWNDVAYVFLTISFPEKNDFLSTLYDQQQKSTRMTYLRDNQGKLYHTRAQVTGENSDTSQLGEVDLLYPTPYGDLGGRINGRHLLDEDKNQARGGLRINTGLVFAYQDGEWGAGLSRPIPGSFVIFKPERQLKGQKIALKSTSPYTEAETGLFDEITFSNLLAYQYRDIQLDPTMLEEGRSLEKEKFRLYPSYRSAHLITLKERGSVTLRGRLYQANGQPLSLQVGNMGGVSFFTNREGDFYVEGLEPGSHKISLEGSDESAYIKIDKEKRGLMDLGQITLEEAP